MSDLARHDEIELAAAYAIGALDADELRAFEAHLATCRECQAAVAEYRRAAAGLARATDPSTPPPDLRVRVLNRATGGARRAQEATTSPASHLPWLAAAAAIALAAAAGVYAAYARAQLTVWRQTASNASTEARQLRADLARARGDARELASAMQVLTAPDLLRVELAATAPAKPTGRAFMSRSRGLVVSAQLLPPLATGRTYQLWMVVPNRPPIGAGLFGVNPNGSGIVVSTAPMNDVITSASSVTFAITDEPAGGSPGPTTPILIAGSAKPN